MKKIAFVGVGDISGIYLENITTHFSKELQIVGLCDLVREKAEQAAEKYGIKKIYQDMFEVFQDDEVDIVLNLTRPNEHYDVSKKALLAGKAVYSEKPLATDIAEGKELLEISHEKKNALGGAPDTFLGAGIQTCKQLIEMGIIGEPIGFRASMINHGHESWHPGPAFYYEKGGGPMFDMGPYYVTALVNLLGAVKTVTAKTKTTFPTRVITSPELYGQEIEVEVPTYYMGILEMSNGAIGELFTTFDCYDETQSAITIYGTKGTIKVPDPNDFGGPVYLLTKHSDKFMEVPLLYGEKENLRGLGLVELAKGMDHDANQFATDVRQTYHVLEVLSAFEQSSTQRCEVGISSADYFE